MENRNFIETVVHTALTKRELIVLINKSFPDEEVGNHGQIAQLNKNAKCLLWQDIKSLATRWMNDLLGRIEEAV